MSAKEKKSSDEMTFFEHIDALRPHLVRGGLSVAVIMVAAFMAKDFIIDTVLFGPRNPGFPTNRFLNYLGEEWGLEALRVNMVPMNVVNTSMAGQFNLHIKVSLITALALAVPYILWELWQFIRPALRPAERRGSRMFVTYVSLCFFAGLLFGYYIIAPLTVNFLSNYTASEQITNMIDVNSYLSTVVNVSLACGAVFQLPLLVYFLARMGILTSGFMRQYRRHAIMVLAVFSAIITPPDVLSMILVSIPLYLLYEYSIHIAARVERKTAINETLPE